MRFVLDCVRDPEGRLTGQLSTPGANGQPFCGTLELLRLVEDHLPPHDSTSTPTGSNRDR
jgi:hypothetical protein